MAVMRNLVIDGQTYETVGEASVTQVVSSGTKIATVTIDGTGTDIYAPSAPAPTAMTEQEVSDAVDAGWVIPAPVPTDLTGTTWLFDETISSGSGNISWNFTSNGNNYTSILVGSSMSYGKTIVYSNGSWTNNNYRTIAITGGTHATSSAWIEWLMERATQIS